ncbi:lipopolysaccharide biosynthesis protein [Chryseobacterium sp. SC28]|uniref:lipopolysaccharide biosynthesis protein n=1 Tax=Chryseobacterium sp. SC28 TaxID=2268028 RepID=UPI000F651715|nr:polysaccharide biosynthesis protein [Chryseobacterium sp. SC28]RRQ45331.1 polysaccharide biosynthesis protein [Chryseobacterium sp. SC28]
MDTDIRQTRRNGGRKYSICNVMHSKFVNALVNKSGLNTAVIFTVASRLVQGAGGFLSIFFVVRFLNKIEQGYFYTFGSILALQVFFELGLTSIITQFTAHEFAKLNFKSQERLEGDPVSLSRISSLLHLSVKWFSVLSLCLFVVLSLFGYIFFSHYGKDPINWFYPWIILVFTSSVNLLLTPILSFLEGLGKVKEIALIRLVQYTLQACLVLSLLSLNFHLFSSPIANFLSLLVIPIFIFFSYRKNVLINIWKNIGSERVNYKKEILPFQWKISLSWISGYFIYQLFNPVVFATEGAIVAGQMGLSLAIFNGIQSISLSWLNTKIPSFSVLIANEEYSKLDRIFRNTVLQSTVVSFLGVLVFLFFLYISSLYNFDFSKRFLSFTLLSLLGFSIIVNQFVAGLAIYLRCHKKEPFLYFSIVIAILIGVGIFLFGRFFGIWGIILWYSFVIVGLSLPWAIFIFLKKRREWHYNHPTY